MAPVIRECAANADRFLTRICVTAQHRQMLDQVLDLFDIKPHYDLDLMKDRQSLPELTAHVLLGVTKVLDAEHPDMVLIQGDTTTTLAAAQAAYYLKIPIAHIEAGLRTHDRFSPFPEEINRRLVSVLSDIHLAPTESAKKNLLAEGLAAAGIHVTGNTVIDALRMIARRQKTKPSRRRLEEQLRRECGPVSGRKKGSKLLLVTGHRRESFGAGFQRICKAISILAKNDENLSIVYPVHLNPNVREPVYAILGGLKNVHLVPPLDYEPFVFLMDHSDLILTDSGGIQEEAPALGVPVLVMRDTSERPEGIEAGAARLVGTDVAVIVKETRTLLAKRFQKTLKAVTPYGDGKASKRIARILWAYFRRRQ